MKNVSSTQLTPLSFLRRSADVWLDKDAVVLGKTSTGKIQKFTLRDIEWSGQVSRIRG